VLVKDTTKTGQEANIDFNLYPLALAELQRVPPDQRVGPLIINPRTGQPFIERRFQKDWRAVARAAGIPDDVLNRDSRAGGVTEGADAGADLKHLRHHASHSSTVTTVRYSRKTLTIWAESEFWEELDHQWRPILFATVQFFCYVNELTVDRRHLPYIA
jgi:hypothetical protein